MLFIRPARRALQRSLFASWRLWAWGRANGCGLAANRLQRDLERSKYVRNKPCVASAAVAQPRLYNRASGM